MILYGLPVDLYQIYEGLKDLLIIQILIEIAIDLDFDENFDLGSIVANLPRDGIISRTYLKIGLDRYIQQSYSSSPCGAV